jgi:type IV secretion system protein VirB6
MSCPAIQTGSKFLAATLAHIDCQAQTIGAYGYGALADPASTVSLAMLGLLTIFIALFGIRLLLGQPMAGRDIIGDVIRIGLVLTLATSWPAWRTVGYDVVINGPAEVARTIGLASGLPGAGSDLNAYLQNADDGLVAMTMYGTGRLTGGVAAANNLGDSFRGIALSDESGFAWGRIFFLTGTIGPYAVTRLAAGILLAIAPLMAGFLLFSGSAGLFWGWVRGLAFSAIASLSLYLVQGVGLALLDPWIADILAQRDTSTLTPSAPTELIVLALAYCIASVGILFVVGRISFLPHFAAARILERSVPGWKPAIAQPPQLARSESPEGLSRASATSEAVASTLRREAAGGFFPRAASGDRTDSQRLHVEQRGAASEAQGQEPLGSSFRRSQRRVSAASEQRDRKA